ncbi:MAG TPA: serine/threonine-protein kinase [Rhodanobacteraceae bacterium]
MHRVDYLLEPGQLMKGALVGAMLRDRLSFSELKPGQTLGAFRIEKELGRGGMGIVYLATRVDGAYDQSVAIKWQPMGVPTAPAAERFRHERQALASLRHPHIARILDGGCSDDGHLWFAMEYVDGVSVNRYAAATDLDWQARIRMLLPIVDAVQFAHAHLLVHRDIKPANVLVDRDWHATLVDFGIAAFLDETSACFAYTEGFASPEQIAGAAPGVATDIWQLGHLLREVLSVSNSSGYTPKLPRDLVAILARATHALPARRYGTVAALHDDLESVLAHRPVSARPPGLLHRLRLLGQAYPVGMSGCVLALLIFIATITGFMLRLAHQRDVADLARANAVAVNAFVENDLLPGADPLQAGSGNVTVAQVAERALAQVEPRLHAEPEVAAQVELNLGRTLANLGHYRSAEHAFALAIAHLTTLHGRHDVRVLQARLARDKYALPTAPPGSETRLRKLRVDVVADLGHNTPLLQEVDNELARAAFLRGNFRLCASRFNVLLPRLAHADVAVKASAYMEMSLCESRLGHFDMALAHARRSVALSSAAFGAEHPYTLESKLALETAMVGMGDYHRAVDLLRKLVSALEQRYGNDHPIALNAMHDLGFALTCAGYPQQGAGWLRRAAQGRAQVLGVDHPWTALSESVLGMALIHAHQLPQAASALTQARAALDSHSHVSNYIQLGQLENEGDLDLAQGNAHAALAKYDAALEAGRVLYPADHPRLAVLQLSRGLALNAAGRTDAGRVLMQQALQRLGQRPDCRPAQQAEARRLVASR